jgi:hypothetical protein
VKVEEEWPWNMCGGVIRGARGNHFCTKMRNNPAYTHCGVVSDVAHKTDLMEGHGYTIPSVTDHSNTASAYLEPTVDAGRF